MVYYSELLEKPILAKDGKKLGVVKDFCFFDRVRYGVIGGIIADIKGQRKMIPWKYISEIGDKLDYLFPWVIYLNSKESEINYWHQNGNALREVIDKQLIDVNGAKVIRVNDILLGKVGNKLIVVGVDTSTSGLLRRLGLGFLIKKGKEHIILWKDVAPLSKDTPNLQLKVKIDRLNQLEPAEIADLIRDLSLEEKEMVFNTLSHEKAAETLATSHPDVQKTVFKTLPLKKIAQMLETLPSNEAAAILNMMPTVNNERVLRLIKPGKAARIQKVLSYGKQTAAAVMSTRVLTISETMRAEQAIDEMRKQLPQPKHIIYLYVEDDSGKLIGVISLKDLILAKPDEIVKNFIKKDIITINANTSLNDVFNLMSKYSLWALPVIDENKKLLGVIRVTDIIEDLVPARIKKQRLAEHEKIHIRNGSEMKHDVEI